MRFYVANFKWVMLISGLLTCTMLLGLISPQASLKSNFGDNLEGPLADIIVRNWSALIGLMGIMLIYGAFVPSVRQYTLIITGMSKVIFIILVLTLGEVYLGSGIKSAIIIDSIMILLFILYLLLSHSYKLP